MATKKFALEKYLTKEDVEYIKTLNEEPEIITDVTKVTTPGIYNFRGCPNVAIWNIKEIETGNIGKKEVVFSFCLRYFDAEEGGIFYINSLSRNLRKITDTENKIKKDRPGPNKKEEHLIFGAFASPEVIRKNSKKG